MPYAQTQQQRAKYHTTSNRSQQRTQNFLRYHRHPTTQTQLFKVRFHVRGLVPQLEANELSGPWPFSAGKGSDSIVPDLKACSQVPKRRVNHRPHGCRWRLAAAGFNTTCSLERDGCRQGSSIAQTPQNAYVAAAGRKAAPLQ